MALARIFVAGLVCIAPLLGALSASALADTPEGCKEPQAGTKEAPIFSPPMAGEVTGAGRLQFYSAPRIRCRMDGVFVIPKDELIEYARTNDGWSSVSYTNPKTGNNVSGWVRSARLKAKGAVGPKQ